MSSNIAKSLNGVLGKILELPIVSMVESISSKLMEWFCIRREKGRRQLALGQTITPNVNKLLLRHQTFSAGLAVKGVSAWSFQFQKLQIPCCHALAAARMKQIDVQTLVGSEYEVKLFAYAYAEFIYPVPNQCDEEVPADVEETEFIPLTNKNGPGHRRKRRIPSTGEFMVE
ncbi:PREDICTED: uncharacterized protein LOC109127305 [Camelina sativa]|uniref:Uncharacterized protein LOC109127305 n=1 Tax=Camelina sativa TaxID=90675 RepID=A0ABM1QL05_CAMSA|nr:PREDICTED: uncharacterized protein LOC109127305 [Camelina sativa]